MEPLSNAKCRELAALFGADCRTVRRWQKAGAPLEDLPAMLQWLDGRSCLPERTEAKLPALRELAKKPQARPKAKAAPPASAAKGEAPPSEEPPGSLREARLVKLRLEAERLRFELEAERRLWIRADEVHASTSEWAALFRNEIEMLCHQTAPLWAGLDAPQIEARAMEWRNLTLARLSEVAERKLLALSSEPVSQ